MKIPKQSDMDRQLISPRSPWTAAVLSLFCTGLGHLYCGRIVRGMGLFLASLAFAPAAIFAAWFGSSLAILISLSAALACYVIVLLFAVIDAWRIARRGAGYRLRDYNNGLVYAAFVLIGVTYPWAAVYFLRDRVFEAFYIPTASMAPTIQAGDRVLVNKLEFVFREPERFDVVVFRVPDNAEQRYIKRIIGLPGDTVEVIDGRVRINGQEALQEPDESPPPPGSQGEMRWESRDGRSYRVLVGDGEEAGDLPPTPVPAGAYFMLGDNRHRSRDSRHFSFVAADYLVGEAQCIYFSSLTWRRLGAIE
jgi:signal peptidase I